MNDYSPGISRNDDPFLKKLKRRRLFVGAIVIASAALLSTLAALALSSVAAKRSSPKATQQSIVESWQAKDYKAVNAACDASLEVSPLDPFFLVFKGFSAFYIGLSESDGERRAALIDESIFSLRKALTDKKAPLRSEATYILGKAYYHKGVDYYNEAIEYLLESTRLGYSQADTWEYLAIASQGAGRVSQSVQFFDAAIAAKPGSPELLLAASLANGAAGDAARSEALALEALSLTSDEYLAERCAFLLGDLYRTSGRLSEALERYEAIKEKNPQSADAWYYQGLVLLEAGDPIRARAAWRKAIAIDPMHSGARQKLSERS